MRIAQRHVCGNHTASDPRRERQLDGERAAETLAAALRNPARADDVLNGFDDATRAAHAEFEHDGTRVMAEDPFGHLKADVLELDGLADWLFAPKL